MKLRRFNEGIHGTPQEWRNECLSLIDGYLSYITDEHEYEIEVKDITISAAHRPSFSIKIYVDVITIRSVHNSEYGENQINQFKNSVKSLNLLGDLVSSLTSLVHESGEFNISSCGLDFIDTESYYYNIILNARE